MYFRSGPFYFPWETYLIELNMRSTKPKTHDYFKVHRRSTYKHSKKFLFLKKETTGNCSIKFVKSGFQIFEFANIFFFNIRTFDVSSKKSRARVIPDVLRIIPRSECIKLFGWFGTISNLFRQQIKLKGKSVRQRKH